MLADNYCIVVLFPTSDNICLLCFNIYSIINVSLLFFQARNLSIEGKVNSPFPAGKFVVAITPVSKHMYDAE